MTSQLYHQLLLVQHIPAIEGITGIQDLIKAFAYTGDLYREKAHLFQKRMFPVLQKIEHIKTLHSTRYTFSLNTNTDNRTIHSFYSAKYLHGSFLFQSSFCPVCGDYKTTYIRKHYRKQYRCTYPKCNCE